MKKAFLLCIFWSVLTNSLAQSIVIADAVDKTPIPFVTVKFNETGLYTNEKGILRTDLTKTKSLELYHLGYKTLKVNTVDIQDTIFMQPQAALLNEVVINAKGDKTIELKPLRKGREYSSFILNETFENVIVLHPKKVIAGFFVDELTIPFQKRDRWIRKDYLEGIKAFVRINIYEVENNLPSTQIYSSGPIEIHAQDKDEIKLDLSHHHILFGEKGLSFGMEFLGFYDDDGNPIKFEDGRPLYMRTSITDRTSKSFTATTYGKYIFDKEANITPLNYYINDYHPGGIKNYDHNLRIGLKLSNPNPGK